MYEIKSIVDSDYYSLLELHYKLQQLFPMKLNRLVSSIALINELNKHDLLVIGLYKDKKLVGFINGYKETSEVFYFSNIFVEKENRLKVIDLMTYAEAIVIDRGYKRWKSQSFFKDGKNILEKFGGQEHGDSSDS